MVAKDFLFPSGGIIACNVPKSDMHANPKNDMHANPKSDMHANPKSDMQILKVTCM